MTDVVDGLRNEIGGRGVEGHVTAIGAYRQALEVYRKDEYPQYFCGAAANLGMALAEQGDNAEACRLLKEAYALREFLPRQGKEIEGLMNDVCQGQP